MAEHKTENKTFPYTHPFQKNFSSCCLFRQRTEFVNSLNLMVLYKERERKDCCCLRRINMQKTFARKTIQLLHTLLYLLSEGGDNEVGTHYRLHKNFCGLTKI
jgi:hypothetical protein